MWFSVFCSLQFFGWWFALWPLWDLRKIIGFQLVQLFCCCCEDESDIVQALYMSDRKLEVLPFTFKLYISFYLKWISYRQHIIGSCFLKSSLTFFILYLGVFRPFTPNVPTDVIRFKTTTLEFGGFCPFIPSFFKIQYFLWFCFISTIDSLVIHPSWNFWGIALRITLYIFNCHSLPSSNIILL